MIEERQRFVPETTSQTDITPRYERNGIYGLYHQEREAHRLAVWRLALEVSRMVNTYWVEPDIAETFASLTNVFTDEAL